MAHIKPDFTSLPLVDTRNIPFDQRADARDSNKTLRQNEIDRANIADVKAHPESRRNRSFFKKSLAIAGDLSKTTIKRARPGEIKKTTKKAISVAKPLVKEVGKFTAVSAAAYFGAGAINASAATSGVALSSSSSSVFASTAPLSNTGSLLGLGLPAGSGTVLAGTTASGTLLTGGALATGGAVVGAGTVLLPNASGVAQTGLTLSSTAATAKNTLGANSVLAKPAIGTGTVLKGTALPAAGFANKLINAGEDATITGLLGLNDDTKPRALESPNTVGPQQKSAVPVIAMIVIAIFGIGVAFTKGVA